MIFKEIIKMCLEQFDFACEPISLLDEHIVKHNVGIFQLFDLR